VNHEAAVAQCPGRSVGELLADEAVLDPEPVVVQGLGIEEVAEAVAELAVAIVGDLEKAVLDPERFGVVVAQLVTGDLGCPAGEVAAVEERRPIRGRCCRRRAGEGQPGESGGEARRDAQGMSPGSG
jgi:hypothetical protein